MKTAYETPMEERCDMSPPEQDHKCPICGSDPMAANYRKALWDIMLMDRKADMRKRAKDFFFPESHD